MKTRADRKQRRKETQITYTKKIENNYMVGINPTISMKNHFKCEQSEYTN